MRPWVGLTVVFLSSFCTMVLELVAGRILAPYIGVSLYTWTSIIGVCLAGISFGNYLGGIIADRWPSRRTLGIILGASAIFTLMILPLIGIATWIPTAQLVDTADRMGGPLRIDRALILILRIVVITTVIFLPPVFLMGMVSPIVIKLALRDLEHAGGLVGRFYAISTLGAIVGTFLTGFVLVQTMGTRAIVVTTGIVLLLLAVLGGDVLRARKAYAPLAILAALGLSLIPVRAMAANGCAENRLVPEWSCVQRSWTEGWESATDAGCLRETAYFCIKVSEQITNDGPNERIVRQLVLDHLVHSYTAIDDPHFLNYGYIKVYAEMADFLAQRLPNQDLNVLQIGGGGYTFARHLEAKYPNVSQVILELDPGVTEVVYDYMGVDKNTTNIVTYNGDGRLMVDQLLERDRGRYDMIVVDAFNDLSVPYHLTTLEFDQKLKQLLKPDGYLVVLVIDKLNGGKFMSSYVKTAQQVWGNVYVMGDTTTWDSSFASTYVVSASDVPLDVNRLRTAIEGQGAGGRVVTNVMPAERMEQWLRTENPPLLTDDYAPVDNFVAPLFAERGF